MIVPLPKGSEMERGSLIDTNNINTKAIGHRFVDGWPYKHPLPPSPIPSSLTDFYLIRAAYHPGLLRIISVVHVWLY